MSERPLIWIDEAMRAHDPNSGRPHSHHPERPERLQALLELLNEPAIHTAIQRRSPSPVDPAALLRVHTKAHVERLLALAGQHAALDPDTRVSTGSVHAAQLAAGSLLEAVDAVCAEQAPSRRAMCLVRPPGHHAEPDRAMGFCLFDNIALAAEAARASGKSARTLIIDWDVHHGNGTASAFYERDDVLCFDLHQHPLFPGSGTLAERGRGAGEGFTVNAPLPAGLGDADYLAIVDRMLPALAARFQPELVLVSAGFDAHADDPLGSMELSAAGFAQLCARARGIADQYAGGRLILALEGGYDLAALRDSVRACIEVLAGGEPARVTGQAHPQTRALINELARVAQI
ncbi:Acetylspermidine deacetylase [Enhygromyxa salina]|uniref:Acetylspermidine deacetylase n=1 Tax=Enhygromyxa salina TaxID=215803 RepID=A0A0C1ZRP9_9BACT|nr:histone deacetylase [Enhygromyxa salina]KIG13688.1 Acetylspermidine deacetylase [Enhygromyxa salina]